MPTNTTNASSIVDIVPAALVGVACLLTLWLALYLCYGFAAKDWRLLYPVVEGADGEPSTSKFQSSLWMFGVAFAYGMLAFVRFHLSQWDGLPDLPTHLATALGMGATTAVASKVITANFAKSGRVIKRHTPTKVKGQGEPRSTVRTDWSGLIRDDYGKVDATKILMLFWTAVALVVFVIMVANHARDALAHNAAWFNDKQNAADKARLLGLPDIDGSLVLLVGIGQGTYLGFKLGQNDSLRLVGLKPSWCKPGDFVTVVTSQLPEQLQNLLSSDENVAAYVEILLNGVPTEVHLSDQPGEFRFTAPEPAIAPPSTGQNVTVGLTIQGNLAGNTMMLGLYPNTP